MSNHPDTKLAAGVLECGHPKAIPPGINSCHKMKNLTATLTFTEKELRFLTDALNIHLCVMNDRIKQAEDFREPGVRRVCLAQRTADFNAAHNVYDKLWKALIDS